MTRTQIGTATVENGVASTTYTIPAGTTTGTHTLYGIFVEDDTYETCEGYNTFEIRLATVTTCSNVLASIGEVATFEAQVQYNTNQNVDSGSVQFQLGGTNIGSPVSVSNGVATLQYEIPNNTATGTKIRAIFIENNTYAGSQSGEATLKIRESTNVTVNNVSANLDTDATITATITDSNGNNIVKGKARLYIDNTQSGDLVNVDSNGQVTFTYHVADNAVLGGHTIKVAYVQNDDYDAGQGTGQLTVRTPTVLTPVNISANKGSTITVTVNVKDPNQVVVPTGTVNITVGSNSPVAATVNSGGEATIQYEVPNDAEGTISFSAEYVQNDNYQSSTMATDGVITIRKGTTIVLSSLKANIGDNVTLSSTVTDENSDNVTSGTVNYEIE